MGVLSVFLSLCAVGLSLSVFVASIVIYGLGDSDNEF